MGLRLDRGPGGALPPDGEHDWVIVRLGAPGVVHAVVVDTAFFTGNYPQSCSVEGCWVRRRSVSLPRAFTYRSDWRRPLAPGPGFHVKAILEPSGEKAG